MGDDRVAALAAHTLDSCTHSLTPSMANAFSIASLAAAGVVGAVVNPRKHEKSASASCSGVEDAAKDEPLDAILIVGRLRQTSFVATAQTPLTNLQFYSS